MLGGMTLPFIKELNSELIILLVLIYLTASIGVFFIRETKTEEQLRNIYSEIFPENEKGLLSPKKKKSFSTVV